MKRTAALTVAAAPEALRGPVSPVDALRARLAGPTARDHAVLEFLADDLREARDALDGIFGYLASVESALADGGVGQEQLLALALGGGPSARIGCLEEVLESLRRRLAQVAARM
jgi:hypothetical protein